MEEALEASAFEQGLDRVLKLVDSRATRPVMQDAEATLIRAYGGLSATEREGYRQVVRDMLYQGLPKGSRLYADSFLHIVFGKGLHLAHPQDRLPYPLDVFLQARNHALRTRAVQYDLSRREPIPKDDKDIEGLVSAAGFWGERLQVMSQGLVDSRRISLSFYAENGIIASAANLARELPRFEENERQVRMADITPFRPFRRCSREDLLLVAEGVAYLADRVPRPYEGRLRDEIRSRFATDRIPLPLERFVR